MWKFTLDDGRVVTGNREEIAKEFNFFDDVYDDEVWDEFCYGFNFEWIDEDDNVDNYVHLTDEEYEELTAKLNKEYEELNAIFDSESFAEYLKNNSSKFETFSK